MAPQCEAYGIPDFFPVGAFDVFEVFGYVLRSSIPAFALVAPTKFVICSRLMHRLLNLTLPDARLGDQETYSLLPEVAGSSSRCLTYVDQVISLGPVIYLVGDLPFHHNHVREEGAGHIADELDHVGDRLRALGAPGDMQGLGVDYEAIHRDGDATGPYTRVHAYYNLWFVF